MPHCYKNIDGWFDFEELYDLAVSRFDNCTFVEVGSWLGKSAVYMGEKIKESNKQIKLICVDTWEGSDEEFHKNYIKDIGGVNKLLALFIDNITNAKVDDVVTYLRASSLEAARTAKYVATKLNFVFIDADHHYESVKSDILAWLPNVRCGGILAGHDYDVNNPASEGVIRAVKEIFGDNYYTIGKCWVKEIK